MLLVALAWAPLVLLDYSAYAIAMVSSDLKDLYPKLVSHSMQYFGAREVMGFLGKNLVGNFRGEVVSDMTDRCKRRLRGMRVKHRAKMNWIKMYDKAGSVLRVETAINQPDAFTVRTRVRRGNKHVTEWVPMRKGVVNLFRYRNVSLAANKRYLEALAVVDDPSTALRQMNAITAPWRTPARQSVKAFNPLGAEDQQFFKARTRRWRSSNNGWAFLSAAVALKEQSFPALHAQASA
jgi:hypothetical protein